MLLFIGAIALTSCSSENDLKKWELKGKVKSVFVRSYDAEKKFGEWELEEMTCEDPYHGGCCENTKTYFDKKGFYEIRERYYKDDLSSKTVYLRENNMLVEESRYDEDGKLEEKTKIKKTSGSNGETATERLVYNGDGKLKRKTVETELSENEFEVEHFDKDNKLKWKYHAVKTKKNGRLTKQVNTYFEAGKKDKVYIWSFEYDKTGNLISEKSEDKLTGKTNSYTRYEYLAFDKNKNWTKRLVYFDEDGSGSKKALNPRCLVTREIEYY